MASRENGPAFAVGLQPLRLDSPCDPSAKPGLLGTCDSLTGTFQGQLFHRRLASAGSYAPRACRLPAQATEVRARTSSFLCALSLIPLSSIVAH